MQAVRQCMQKLSLSSKLVTQKPNFLTKLAPVYVIPNNKIHLSSALNKAPNVKEADDFAFMKYNEKVFPPLGPNEERRPAYVCHVKPNIKYSPKKMWYIAMFIRGMTVDEAIKQLSFVCKKGAAIVKETLLEAQKKAVDEHNVEFKSNLWVAESFATKGLVIKGVRRHAKVRLGMINYRYCNYFVRLEEGKPPENYYFDTPKSGEELLDNWMANMRKRKISNSL